MKSDERRRQILEHAKALFSRRGYHNTQISDIIASAGIARGTVYQYFTGKEDIFTSLMREYYARWVKSISIDTHRIDLKSITPLEYFRFRVSNTLTFLANDPELCNIVLRMGTGLSGELSAAARRFEKKILGLITDDLRLGVRSGAVRKDIDIDIFANLIVGAVLKTAHYFFVERKSNRDAESIAKMSDTIVSAFAPSLFS